MMDFSWPYRYYCFMLCVWFIVGLICIWTLYQSLRSSYDMLIAARMNLFYPLGLYGLIRNPRSLRISRIPRIYYLGHTTSIKPTWIHSVLSVTFVIITLCKTDAYSLCLQGGSLFTLQGKSLLLCSAKQVFIRYEVDPCFACFARGMLVCYAPRGGDIFLMSEHLYSLTPQDGPIWSPFSERGIFFIMFHEEDTM